jgi:hypothetical protein
LRALYSDLPAGTAGTGWVHPWRAAGTASRWVRRARVDNFFFKTVPYLFHIRARRGYTGTGTGVLGHTGRRVGNGTGQRVGNGTGRWVKRYNGLLKRYNDL